MITHRVITSMDSPLCYCPYKTLSCFYLVCYRLNSISMRSMLMCNNLIVLGSSHHLILYWRAWLFFVDNEVFACGSHQDGRLGIGICTQNIALPRPLFGTLHAVSNICCSHWETMLVAGMCLNIHESSPLWLIFHKRTSMINCFACTAWYSPFLTR